MGSSVLLCIGTRPEVIKMAPVYHALKKTALEPIVLHTGQHEAGTEPDRHTVWPLYEFFGFLPAYRVDLVRRTDTLAHLTALLMEELTELLTYIDPGAVLVQGDTTTAFTAGLSAFYRKTPIGHVEAGLRTYNEYDPFPEEKNRQLITRLSRWHFTPTHQSTENLLREGIPEAQIFEVGNTVVDAVQWGIANLDERAQQKDFLPRPLQALPERLAGHRLLLITAHRRENWGARIAQIARAARTLLERNPDLLVVWPVHPNPKVHMTVQAGFESLAPGVAERLFLTPGLSYPCVLWLLSRAWMVLTDSGGIQEEAAATSTPVLVLRETTERPELLAAGAGRLVGTDPDTIVDSVMRLQADAGAYETMRGARNPFGDGKAATYIAEALVKSLGAEQPSAWF
jgi:UDP-N-acetylglucosamine 2-epimerase (non-hydrolysing)